MTNESHHAQASLIKPEEHVDGVKSPGEASIELLVSAFAPVKDELNQLGKQIGSYVTCETQVAQDVLNHVLNAGGKRIRPAIFFMSARLSSYDGAQLIPMAAVAEFIHTASLLHDDVIDDSKLRRGHPSGNAIWGDRVAVLVGDLIYARASEMMAETGCIEVVKTYAKAIRVMSEGEILQLESLFSTNFQRDDYFKVLFGKTGILIASLCKVAGILAKLSEEKTQALYNFGLNVGYAFQLLDDALDYSGTDEVLGKKKYMDLFEGKITLPLIIAYEKSSVAEQYVIVDILRKSIRNEHEINKIIALINKYNSRAETLSLAAQYTEKAMASLSIFSPSQEREDLENLARFLLRRIY